MSTRAVVNFYNDYNTKPRLVAKVYRHSDGYPDGLGEDLKKFLKDVGKLSDTRFGDASYLAAKWVVWDAEQHAVLYNLDMTKTPKANRLDFLGVGICMTDPGDIEYSYDVVCDSSFGKESVPKITHKKV